MPAADTIDIADGAQDLATWSALDGDDFTIAEMSMVKDGAGNFWVAEIVAEIPQVRKITSGGTQTVYTVVDQLSPLFEGFAFGVADLILATDGTNIWLAILAGYQETFTDQACVAHPTPAARILNCYELGVAIFATSAPSSSWTDEGPAFYVFGKEVAATNNNWGAPAPSAEPPILDGADIPMSTSGAFTACASSAQEGVLHVMWAECGYAGNFNPCDFADNIPSGDYKSRLSYSKWSTSGLDTQVDLLSSTENWGTAQVSQGGAPLVADAVAFCNATLRNDTGSPVAFVNQLASYSTADVASPDDFQGEAVIRMWDLSSPVAGSPDELQNSSGTAPVDISYILISNNFATIGADLYMGPPWRGMLHCAAPYDDPLLSSEAVYLVSFTYISTVDTQERTCILRVPCDGSAAFDFLDGDAGAGVGINRDAGQGDFVSETRNVWWPSFSFASPANHAKMMQYDRICAHAWLRDFESPGESASTCPRGIDLTDNLISFVSSRPTDSPQHNALTQQVILRMVNPCGGGLHVWRRF